MVGIGKVNSPIVPCTREKFYEAVQSKFVQDTCDMIKRLQKKAKDEPMRAEWAKKCIAQAKKSLPCITPMATFKDNRRSNANAIPSGLNMIDVDHVQNPAELWEAIKSKELPYHVVLVHITPSSFGLRIVFEQPKELSIPDAQRKMAEACGVVYDEVTKDMARCSFLVPFDYILLINDKILFGNENTTKNDSAELQQSESQNKEADTARESEPVAARWKRLRLSEERIRNSRPYSRIFRMRKSLNHSFSLWDLTKHLLRVSGTALCTLFVVILDLFVILMSISFVLCCLIGVFRWMRCVLQ